MNQLKANPNYPTESIENSSVKLLVFKIGKLLIENLDTEFDISRKWASQNYSILKKRLAERKVAGVLEN